MSHTLRAFVASRRVPVVCGCLALAMGVVVALAALTGPQGHVSTFVRMSVYDAMAPHALAADRSFVLIEHPDHYDGLYYYTIARDPFALGDFHTAIDRSAYRYGHPGYAWLAAVLSSGNAVFIPHSLLAINLLSLLAAGYLFSRLAEALRLTPWVGAVVALSPGLLFAVIVDTPEPFVVALMAGVFLLWHRARVGPASLLLAFTCLVKEPMVLVIGALAAWECLRAVRERRIPLLNRMAWLALPTTVVGLWHVYLKQTFGVWSFSQVNDLFGIPFGGWAATLQEQSFGTSLGGHPAQLALFGIALLVMLGGVMIGTGARAGRLRSPLDVMFLGYLLLASVLNWQTLLFPKDAVRELVIPLLLVPFVWLNQAGMLERSGANELDDSPGRSDTETPTSWPEV